jgi:oligoendopeptidase F
MRISFASLRVIAVVAVVAVIALPTIPGLAQERERSATPDRYKWNLSEIYPTLTAWRAAKDTLAADLPQLAQYRGKLGGAATTLADALDKMYALDKELSRIYVYASMLADEDTRDSTNQGMQQEMTQLASAFGAQVAYVEPEILRLPKGTTERFVAAEPRLRTYRFYLNDIARRAPHTLSDNEEKILADVGPLAGSASNIYNILSNADFPYPTITLADGRSFTVNQAGYNEVRASANRVDREKGMSAFFGAISGFSRTFGTTMNSSAQKAQFFSKTRKYGSSLESSLDGPNIPVSVYTRLVEGVNANLSSFHRYLQLRKRMMGVSELHYYDLYAPLVSSVNLEYTPEQSQQHILTAMAPLGPEYLNVLKRAFAERWVDVYPSPGKRSGAYSNGGAYDVHPYILMNFNGKYDDMSTLAHELGHTMQSYLSNKAQPYPLASYPTFVAEVASTFNESLLIDHMLKTIKDDNARLSILGSYLENIKGTVFRQTQFAEFELRMHEMAQKGQPITGEALANLYMDITKRYYGHDKGVTVVDDYVAHEWSFVPHFYRDFYVFQYATSFTASEALAAPIKAGNAEAIKKYLAFLSAGGSKYPIDLLKDAGVDMTTDAPLTLAIKEMNRVMDEMEKILSARPGTVGPR